VKKFKQGTLLKNTIMLYILQFSTYFLSLVTVPYQTRVLGPVVYGYVGVAIAVMTYFQLFMDFGFLLSATEDISQNRDDRDYVNRKFTSVTILKLFLAAISIAVLIILCLTVPMFAQNKALYIIYINRWQITTNLRLLHLSNYIDVYIDI
jgi:PST family polysaccharide transporter